MIAPIDFGIPRVVGFRVNGPITTADIQPWASLLENKIQQEGKLRVYVEYETISGITWNALVQDLKFDLKHLGDFEKAAIVSDRTWLNLAAKVAGFLPNLEVKTFSFTEKEQAKQWIMS
ncbi:SpoIIAA-like protein [Larkinella arboricola]|uniref:SpoIIAA-like protein n=1 Tax=Larkinella arboricola TaxID=643671 RepID=A0A327WX01_LARAB|nr:STAS/SEC14 domain-containing protein [Larkinella arboricola]RAJ97842.1 SpoIIAA-like protein [Larkinella arboricola]